MDKSVNIGNGDCNAGRSSITSRKLNLTISAINEPYKLYVSVPKYVWPDST